MLEWVRLRDEGGELDGMRAVLDRFPHRVAFGVAVAALLLHSAWLHPWAIDDAYIYLRYAQNLAGGEGIVYNVGERVEGYTTFVWVVLLGAGGALGLDLLILAKLLGTAFALAALGLLASAHLFVEGITPRTSAVATLLLGSCGAFTAWATGGMDATMVGFFSTLIFMLHAWAMQAPGDRSRAWVVGAVGGLAVVARPECVLVLSVLGADRLWSDVRRRDWSSAHMVGAFLVVYAPYYAWRYSYYGYPLPNTFYAKVGATSAQLARGAEYVGRFFWSSLALSLVALASIPLLGRLSRQVPRAAVLPAAFVLHTIYVLAVGGDAMPAFRFFVSVVPLLCLAAALVLMELAPRRPWLLIAVVVVTAVNLGQTAFGPDVNRAIRQAKVGDVGREVGLWLRESMPPDTLIAINAAGAIAYYSELPVVDMLGLNDPHIAHRQMPRMGQGMAGHEKGDGAYVLSREPDLIQFGPSWGEARPVFVGDGELARSPEFERRYVLATYALPSGRKVRFHRKRD
jgi:4-amino-4-deoxy-L-arabinose transferase-like glycosyltransferase